MVENYDIKPILNWAQQNGEAKIIDRVLLRLLPVFIKNEMKMTDEMIESCNEILVKEEIYKLIKKTVEELVGSSCEI